MSYIDSATIYKATMPDEGIDLAECLLQNPFQEPMELQMGSIGFVPMDEDGSMVVDIDGGYAFRVRIANKMIPGAVLRANTEKAVRHVLNETGRKPGKKERADIRENVLVEMMKTAFVTTREVTCFYSAEKGYLIIPVTSKEVAWTIVYKLINAMGSIKTETIHVSDVKGGLTTRLTTWLEQDGDTNVFGEFWLCGEAVMASSDAKQKIHVKMNSITNAKKALQEAIARGFGVESLRLGYGSTSFGLTSKFQFRSFDFATDANDNAALPFFLEAGGQVQRVEEVVSQLCELLGYQANEQQAEAA